MPNGHTPSPSPRAEIFAESPLHGCCGEGHRCRSFGSLKVWPCLVRTTSVRGFAGSIALSTKNCRKISRHEKTGKSDFDICYLSRMVLCPEWCCVKEVCRPIPMLPPFQGSSSISFIIRALPRTVAFFPGGDRAPNAVPFLPVPYFFHR